MATKEEKARQQYEYEIRCFIHEKKKLGKKEEEIIEALQSERNINREDAIFFMDRLNSDAKDPNSNGIVWGLICFVGGGSLAVINFFQAPTYIRGYGGAAVVMIYGAYRLLRGTFGKVRAKKSYY